MEQGKEVHRRAQSLFTKGQTAAHPDFIESLQRTKSLMDDPKIEVILEAAIQVGNYTARADMLIRRGGAWELIEVKSTTSVKPELIEDVAYTCMVLRKSGITISKASLMIISRDYRLGMLDEELFQTVNVSDEVFEMVEQFSISWNAIDQATSQSKQPMTSLCFDCRNCPCCYEEFVADKVNHIFDLPRLSKKKFVELQARGIDLIKDIPADFKLTENQERVVEAVRLNHPIIGKSLGHELNSVNWPAGYLDFETFSTGIPEFEEVAPWEHVVIQYSLHVCSAPGMIENHAEFLCDYECESTKDLAEQLIDDCDGLKCIFVYSNFEARMLTAMKVFFPDLSRSLDDLISRLVDLERIIKKSYYHPGFAGRTSIKKTLPVLVPELTYDGMEISDGGKAMAAFAFLRKGSLPSPKSVIKNLLEYCRLDTLAMVKIHECLAQELK